MLRVTAPPFWNVGDEIAFFILLDDNGERIGTLSDGPNYTPQAEKATAERADAWALSIRQP